MGIAKKIAYRTMGLLTSGPMVRVAETRLDKPDAASQLQLAMAYQAAAAARGRLPRIDEVGFRVYSQTDEDGILLYLFALLGSGRRHAIEMCAGSGLECNSSNLIINHGWHALLFDGDEEKVRFGKRYFSSNKNTCVFPPLFVSSWITRGNVNELIAKHGFTGDIDLFSLDLDGVDYHIWKAMDVVTPRVVVVEYNNILGPERSVTVPYADNFNGYAMSVTDGTPNYFGASLAAFVKLGREKGYRLVGTNRYGYNAFFVRNDLMPDLLPEVQARDCFAHPKNKWDIEHRYPLVRDKEWIEV